MLKIFRTTFVISVLNLDFGSQVFDYKIGSLQTGKALIRLFLQEQSNMDLHSLHRFSGLVHKA